MAAITKYRKGKARVEQWEALSANGGARRGFAPNLGGSAARQLAVSIASERVVRISARGGAGSAGEARGHQGGGLFRVNYVLGGVVTERLNTKIA